MTEVVVVIVFSRTGVWWVVVRNKAGERLKVGMGNFMWMGRSLKSFNTPLLLRLDSTFATKCLEEAAAVAGAGRAEAGLGGSQIRYPWV